MLRNGVLGHLPQNLFFALPLKNLTNTILTAIILQLCIVT